MTATKPRKPAKSKTTRMKDLKPVKNPKGGSQKKEDPLGSGNP